MNKIISIFFGFLFSIFSPFKLNSQSNTEWTKYFHSPDANANEEARSFCMDYEGNVILTGVIGIDPAVEILKYDENGNVIWDLSYPGGSPNKIIFNEVDKFFISGTNGIYKLTVLGDISLVSSGNYTNLIFGKDNYIYGSQVINYNTIKAEKYNIYGIPVWTKNYGGSPYNYRLYRMFQGVDNKIHIMGLYIHYSTFGSYSGPVYLTYDTLGNSLGYGFPQGSVAEARNDFLHTNFFAGYQEQSVWHSKINLYNVSSTNNILNTSYYTGTGNSRNEPYDIVCDNTGSVYVACRSWGVAVDYDFVILKYDVNGNLLWDYRFNGSQNSYDAATKIKLDNSGNVIASGTITQSLRGIRLYTVKLSPDGQLLWSDKFGRVDDVTDSNVVNDLQLDVNGNIYLCGKSRNPQTQKYDFLTVKYSSPTVSVKNENEIVKDFKVLDNYPNPFNPETNLKFVLAKNSPVKISIYNSGGKKITQLLNSFLTSGEHTIKWNASEFPSGIYFISFESGNFKEIKKAVLNK